MWENKGETFHGWLITIRVPLTDLKDPWDMSENHCSKGFQEMPYKPNFNLWMAKPYFRQRYASSRYCSLRCFSVEVQVRQTAPRLPEAAARKTKRKSPHKKSEKTGLSISVWVLQLSEKFPFYVPWDFLKTVVDSSPSDSHYDESYRINFYQCHRYVVLFWQCIMTD